MATSSADPDALDDFVSTSRDLNADLAPRVTALERAFEAFLAEPSDVGIGSPSQSGASPPRLEHFGDTIESARAHRNDRDVEADWTQVVSRAFREAGSGGTLRFVDDAILDERLAAAGVPAGAPTQISVEAPSAAGLTVDSGFKDDPVNCGTGSFIEPEVDVPAPARLWAMTWMRNHNSRFPRPGPLGRGWSSWATTRLDVTAEGARFEGPDGQVVELARTDDGFATDSNLAAEVVETEAGTELSWWRGERWRFGPDGRPSEIVLGPAGSVLFHHDDHGRLRAMAHDAGRRLDVEWAGERITAVRASHGGDSTCHTVAYEYIDGDLVASHAPAGRRAYEVDGQGRVVAVVDADGVELARNTYDLDGRVLEQRSPRGLRTTYDYRPGLVTTARDGEDGPRVVMFHDTGGRLTGAVDDHGGRLTRRFDKVGNLISVRDRAGAVTSQEFGPQRRLVRRVLPGGAEERFTYDEQGRLASCEMAGDARITLDYGSDADVLPTRITDPEGATTVVEADGDLVRRITDADGVTVTFEHDAEGFPVRVTDGLGNRSLLERDGAGRIIAIRLPAGQTQRFEHDGAGRLVRRTDADGSVWEATWSPAGRPTGWTTPDGSRFEWRHDGTGDLQAFVDPLGAITTMETDLLGNVVRIVAADGAKFDLTHDGLSRLTALHDPADGSTHYEHDANGRVVGTTNALGHTRRAEYDQRGNVVRTVDAEGRATTMAYDQAGRVTSRTLPDGGTEIVGRDRCGRPTSVTDATGNTTRYEYTPAGRLRRVVSPLGNATEWHYDVAGRIAGRTDPAGAVTRYGRDANGWVTSVVHPDGEVTRLMHDPCGRVVERHHPDGGVDRLGYDALGRPVEVTDATGSCRRLRYDARGLLVEATDAAGGVTRYEHDVRGMLTSITDAAGGTVRYQRDPMARITASTDALGRVTRLHHDQAGRPRLLVEPDGRSFELRFDRTSAVVGVVAGGVEATFGRDPLGRVERVVDHTGDHRFERDAAGRLTARHGLAGTLRWRYDADGRPNALVHSDGTEERYEHDAAGRLVTLSHPVAGRVELTRDGVGRLTGMRSAGLDRSWVWRRHRLVGYRDGLHRVELGRDGAGRVIEVRRGEDEKVTHYGYDVAGRLTGADDTRYRYDAAGRLEGEDGPAGSVRYWYDASHRLVTVEREWSRVELSYDGAGRRVAESGGGRCRRYRWDPFGRLSGVDAIELSVNALGELVGVDGVALGWDTAGSMPQLRRIGDRSVFGAGEPWAVVADGEARWLSRDWDASPIGAVGDPWGRPARPGPDLEPGFRGEWMLDGLLWLRHRAYDPRTRSFLSPDPMTGVAGTTTVANPYHYCHHDPVGWIDPLGLQPLTDGEWDAWKSSHPTLAQMVTAPARAAADLVADHWEVIAAIAVVGVGVALIATGNPVGAGILIGAGSNLAVQVMRGGPIDARNVALSGVVGGASAGIGSMATTAASSAAPVAASSYAAAIPEVVGSTVGAFSNGVLTETFSERLDRNPLNDEVSTRDVLVETTGGFVFGGIKSTVPHGNEVLDLRLSKQELVGARHISEAGKSLSSDSLLANQGDGAEWPTGGPRP